MAMYDYFLKFSDETTAKTALAQYLNPDGNWPASYCIPGVQVWRVSNDVVDGQGNVTHTYLPGFFIQVSLPVLVPALRDAAPVQVVINRDLGRTRAAVIKSNVPLAVLNDMLWQPVFVGADNPFGDMG